MRGQMHLGLFLLGTGSHVAGWRYPGAVDNFLDISVIQDVARAAEAAKLDLLFVGDNLFFGFNDHPSYAARLEPVTMLAAVAVATKHIGLGATASTTYSDPYTVARAFASLDHISHGRAAWNAVTSATAQAGPNYGQAHPNHADRYRRAEEFVSVVRGLWDCWDEGALIADRRTGAYFDEARIRRLDHVGEIFSVRGPLSIPRSPQGHPVVLQAGGSDPGQELAARTADVVFTVVQDMEEAKLAYRKLKDRLPRHGRIAEQMTVLAGVTPVIGRTNREAHDKLNTLQSYVNATNALQLLSDRLGQDMTGYPLDGPVPDLPLPDTYHSFAPMMLAKARRENLSLRDLYNLVGAARGHWVLCGSAEYVADTFELWFKEYAADGFNVMPPYFPEGMDDFTKLVVPILQERGLFRTDYAGTTLRDHFGLAKPARR